MNRSYLSEFIIILLLGFCLFLFFQWKGCGNHTVIIPSNGGDTLVSKKAEVDSSEKKMTPENVRIVRKDSLIYVNTPIDTQKILQAYFTRKIYERQFKDSLLEFNLADTVEHGELKSGLPSYKIFRPTKIETTLLPPVQTAKVKVFAGFGLGGNETSMTSFTPELELIMYDKRAFSVGYNLQNKSVELGVKWKISFR